MATLEATGSPPALPRTRARAPHGSRHRLLIKPRAEGVGLFEFHQLDAARDAGREAARDALEVAPAELFA
jgi:hypothetical protein